MSYSLVCIYHSSRNPRILESALPTSYLSFLFLARFTQPVQLMTKLNDNRADLLEKQLRKRVYYN